MSAAKDVAGQAAGVLAPLGRLRVAINFGNAALAQRDAATGAMTGTAVALAGLLADRLSVALEIVPYDAAGQVVASLDAGAWDMAFLAIDPLRAARLVFTNPYAQIAACFMVPQASTFTSSAEVDVPDACIAVGNGAAYDLYLTRHLKHAALQRFETAAASFAALEAWPLSAAAGIRGVLQCYVETRPHLRVLLDDFLVVSQAICVPRERLDDRPDILAWLNDVVETCKRDGWVAEALAAGGSSDAVVAPLAVSTLK